MAAGVSQAVFFSVPPCRDLKKKHHLTDQVTLQSHGEMWSSPVESLRDVHLGTTSMVDHSAVKPIAQAVLWICECVKIGTNPHTHTQSPIPDDGNDK